jgi:hypothetical protein
MVNERKITQTQLAESDKLIVGQSVFKFAKVEVASREKVIKEDTDEPKKGSKPLLPILILVAIFAAIFLMEDDKQTDRVKDRPQTRNMNEVSNEYITQLKKRQANEDKLVKKNLEVIYQRGLREYREGNYFRAIHEFTLALIMSPGDAQAEHYLRKTKEDLDGAIEASKAKAARDEESLKFQSAIVSYCSIIRLLYSVPDDPRYKYAEDKIKKLEATLGLEPGETNCLKKQRTDQ